MRIAVLGTGVVGQTLAGALSLLGHEVVVGTRDAAAAAARRDPDARGAPGFGVWLEEHPEVTLARLADATQEADLVVLAVAGTAALDVLDAVGEDVLADRVLLDVTNPLDFSAGFPPTLSVCNTDSLAEQIQRQYPRTHVVKSLNTVTAALMVNPRAVGDGQHSVFVSGDDEQAKRRVSDLLRSLGWVDVLDLGGLSTARGTEMYLALWVRLLPATGGPMLNVRVVR